MANAEPLDSILANLLMDHCNEMLLAVNVSTRSIVAANAKACRLLGYPWEDMVGMNIEAIESGLTGMFYWQEVANGNIQELESAESEFQRSDGSTMPVEKTVSKDIIGMQHFVLISARDITSRLHVEDELARVQKKLANRDFMAKAKAEVIQKEKDKAVQFEEKIRTLRSSLEKIDGLQAGGIS